MDRAVSPQPAPPGNLSTPVERFGVLEALLCLLMSGLVAVVFLQVLFRYVIYQPFAWTEEGARFLFIWLCLIGAAVAAKRGAHFAVDFVPRSLLPGRKRILVATIKIIEASFYGVVIWGGVMVVQVVRMQVAPSLGISMSLPYASIVAGSLLMVFFSLRDALHALRPGSE